MWRERFYCAFGIPFHIVTWFEFQVCIFRFLNLVSLLSGKSKLSVKYERSMNFVSWTASNFPKCKYFLSWGKKTTWPFFFFWLQTMEFLTWILYVLNGPTFISMDIIQFKVHFILIWNLLLFWKLFYGWGAWKTPIVNGQIFEVAANVRAFILAIIFLTFSFMLDFSFAIFGVYDPHSFFTVRLLNL